MKRCRSSLPENIHGAGVYLPGMNRGVCGLESRCLIDLYHKHQGNDVLFLGALPFTVYTRHDSYKRISLFSCNDISRPYTKKKKKKAKQSKHAPQNPLVAIFLSLVSGQLDEGIVVVVSHSSTCMLPPANATNPPNPQFPNLPPPTSSPKKKTFQNNKTYCSFRRGPLHKTLQPPLLPSPPLSPPHSTAPFATIHPPNRTVLVSLALIRADGWVDGWVDGWCFFWGGVEGGGREGGGREVMRGLRGLRRRMRRMRRRGEGKRGVENTKSHR